MDTTKVREEFTSYLSKIDELNRSLLVKLSGLENLLADEKKRHTLTKELLLKTQRRHQNNQESSIYKGRLIRTKQTFRKLLDDTKKKEQQWIDWSAKLRTDCSTCSHCGAENRFPEKPSRLKLQTLQDISPTEDISNVSISNTSTANISSTSVSSVRKVSSTNVSTANISASPPLQKYRQSISRPKRPALSPGTTRVGVSKLRRIKPNRNKSRNLSASPGQAENTVVLYAADSQDPEDVTSSRNLTLTHASTKYTSTPQNETPGPMEETRSPDSPVLDLHELSSRDIMSSFMEAPETPTRPSLDIFAKPPAQKQFRLLTEFGANVSRIDENLLGFSLPDFPNNELIGDSPTKEMVGDFPEPVTPEPVSVEEEPASCASSSILPAPTMNFIRPALGTTSRPDKRNEIVPEYKTDFKHVKVIRKKEERAKLAASSCGSCYRYYKACGLDDEEILKQIGDVSRHRHQHGENMDATPPGFWDLTISKEPIPTEPATQRKRNKYLSRIELGD